MSHKSILLLEDLPEMQIWLQQAIEQSFPDCHLIMASTLAEALQQATEHKFDMAVVDLGLPDGSGLNLLKALPDSCLSVVVTAFSDDEHIFRALQYGAGGYVLKDMGQAHIAQLLSECALGRPPISPAIARRVLQSFQKPDDSGLSTRQQEVLSLIAKGYSTMEVADLLQISVHTVQGYIKEIYQKLDIHSRAEAATEAARLGLLGL